MMNPKVGGYLNLTAGLVLQQPGAVGVVRVRVRVTRGTDDVIGTMQIPATVCFSVGHVPASEVY